MRTVTEKWVLSEAVLLLTIAIVANIAQSVKIYQPRKGEGNEVNECHHIIKI